MLFGYSDPSRGEGEKLEFGFKHMLRTLWQCVYPLVKLNLCFLLFCVPVVTIPPAIAALHAGCVDLIRGKKVSTFKLYLHTIRKQFFSSWAVLLILLVPFVMAVGNAVFYFNRIGEQPLILVPALVMSAIAVVIFLMVPYAATMQARVALNIRKTVKNAFLLTFLNLPFTVCSSLLILLILVLSMMYWIYALPLTMSITFAVCAYIGVYFSLYGLQKFVLTEEL